MDERTKRLVERLRTYTVPELCDGSQNPRVMDYTIKPWIERKRIAGPAFTIDVPAGDGGLIPDAIEQLEDGHVLVIAGKGSCSSSYWGDHRSLCASMKNAEGIVVDGAFRDLEGCEAVGLPIYARGLTGNTASKKGEGILNAQVLCGGAIVRPGDIIVGDVNGICVIRPEEAEEILARTARKVTAQEKVLKEMKRTGEVITRIKWS